MKTKFLAALAFLFFIQFTNVNAQSAKTPHHERQRIRQGVRSGKLTRAETKNLVNQQKDIHHDRNEAGADGVITQKERKDIKTDERHANRSIYKKKHNNRQRN